MFKRKGGLLLLVALLLTFVPAQAAVPPDDTVLSPADGATAASPPEYAPEDLTELLSPYIHAHEKPPIVLVHGWQGVNFDKPDCERPTDPAWADALWNHFDEDLEALGFHVEFALLKSGSSFEEPECTPVAEYNAPFVAEAIDLALANSGQDKAILIAHSMGGLVSRAYLESDLYRGDVVALYTLGSPHVGVPVEVLAELVEILTLGMLTLEEYCVAQPVACQFSDNESANPPGFSGIETFNAVHHPRAEGVYYHMLGGDVGFDHRAWLAELLYALIPGPNDGIVPLPSAMGVSSADDGSGPPLPLLGPLSGVIDRLEVYAAHTDSFCDDPSLPYTCEYHYNYHDYDRYCADWDLSIYLDEVFRSSSFFDCIEATVGNRLPDHVCGVAEDLTETPSSPPPFSSELKVRGRLPSTTGSLAAGHRATRTLYLDGEPAMLLAHGPLYETRGRLSVSLVAPDGQVIDPGYATLHPDQVRYKGAPIAGLYLLLDPLPGEWQLVIEASHPGTDYRTTGLLLEASEGAPAADSSSLPTSPLLSAPAIKPIEAAAYRPDIHQSPHSCSVDNTGPYLPGDTIQVSFELQVTDEDNYVEWVDTYFVDAPNGWSIQTQSAAPYDDLGDWGRSTTAQSCDSPALAYWGVESPYLAPVDDLCSLGANNLPLSGSFNGPWARSEWYDVTPVEGFEGSFPPPGWAMYKTGGGSDNNGFQKTNARAHNGLYSAFHDDDNPWPWDPIETWLVIPAHTVQAGDILAFWQNENYEDYYSYHGVWVSTGSADPNDGDFIEGVELGPGQEDTWEEVWLDIDFFSGKTVYFAFKYEGDYSDEWYLDDVSIKRRRLLSTNYDFDVTFGVDPDSPYSCPGSPYIGVTSWYSDTKAGLVGVALGDLVTYSRNITTCGVSQPCPLPEIAITETVSLDGICPGLPSVEVPENLQDVTFCFEIENTSDAVSLRDHSLRVPALGGAIFSGTLPLEPGASYSFPKDWNFGGQEGECFTAPSTWEATTPVGFGQPQGEDADVPFITTTYSAEAVGDAQVCVTAPLLVDLSSDAFAVDEGAGNAAVTVTLSAEWVFAVTVDYATSDGTATAGEDYVTTSGNLTFTPGITEQIFAVPLLDDLLDEETETVVLTLSKAVHADIGGNNPATLTIRDDDVLPVYLIYLPLVVKGATP